MPDQGKFCKECKGQDGVTVMGECKGCGGMTSSSAYAYCAKCSVRKHACMRCGKLLEPDASVRSMWYKKPETD